MVQAKGNKVASLLPAKTNNEKDGVIIYICFIVLVFSFHAEKNHSSQIA